VGEILLVEYQKLLELNQKINHQLKAGNTHLEQLLAASWEAMRTIDRLPAPQDSQELQNVQALLAELVRLHQENQELIRQQMSELREELAQVKKGKAAQHAYGKQRQTAKFLDEFK
jgi:hypothetical protein